MQSVAFAQSILMVLVNGVTLTVENSEGGLLGRKELSSEAIRARLLLFPKEARLPLWRADWGESLVRLPEARPGTPGLGKPGLQTARCRQRCPVVRGELLLPAGSRSAVPWSVPSDDCCRGCRGFLPGVWPEVPMYGPK